MLKVETGNTAASLYLIPSPTGPGFPKQTPSPASMAHSNAGHQRRGSDLTQMFPTQTSSLTDYSPPTSSACAPDSIVTTPTATLTAAPIRGLLAPAKTNLDKHRYLPKESLFNFQGIRTIAVKNGLDEKLFILHFEDPKNGICEVRAICSEAENEQYQPDLTAFTEANRIRNEKRLIIFKQVTGGLIESYVHADQIDNLNAKVSKINLLVHKMSSLEPEVITLGIAAWADFIIFVKYPYYDEIQKCFDNYIGEMNRQHFRSNEGVKFDSNNGYASFTPTPKRVGSSFDFHTKDSSKGYGTMNYAKDTQSKDCNCKECCKGCSSCSSNCVIS